MASVWNNVWPYLVAVLIFIALIIIHEFGHFIAAKILGVRVNEFAVGFGPKLFSKKVGETVYKANLIPLGGYCAMEGEDSTSSDPKAFCNKAAWRRFIIVIMGATFNLILGFVLVAAVLAPEKRFTTTTVAEFSENASSMQSGLKENDKILSVDGRKIYTTYDLSYAFTNVKNGIVDMTVLRDGQKVRLKAVKFDTENENGISYIKVDFRVYGKKKTLISFISETFKTGISYCAVIWRSLIDLISGKYGISAVSGPVGVTAAIGNVAKQNLRSILPIAALITINLGLFNLLPLPALDGGRLLFITIEMITRKKVPPKYESLVHTAGFIILIAFMLLITLKDIWSLIYK
ncbi:MAG: site-2 protease family protein [Clostridia bacterium]|nr:site-2 protease family protein [Clostridia bacterium]